jgi:hypothetical protein
VQALGVTTTFKNTTCELVDDHHLTGPDEIVHVELVERLCLERYIEVMDEVNVCVVIEVFDLEHFFDSGDASFGGDHLSLLLVDFVVVAISEPRRNAGELGVPLAGFPDPARNDQWGSCLVDENRVNLIDDGVGMAPLDHVLGIHRHVVTQIVETELVVGSVRDVGRVFRASFLRRHPSLDEADLESQEAMDIAHPGCVTACEIVVDRHDVDTATG